MALQPVNLWNSLNNLFTGFSFSEPSIGPILFTPDGVLTNPAYDALVLGFGSYTVTNNGVIGSTAPGRSGIVVDAGPATASLSKITVGTTGQVFGDIGITLKGLTNISNAGTIAGKVFGVHNKYSGNCFLTNTGTISGGTESLRFETSGIHTIKNSGTLNGDVHALGAGVELMTNSGVINGDVDLGDGKNILTNSGTISGGVLFGADDDKFTNSGTVAFGAAIDMGAGNDSFIGGKSTDFVIDANGSDKYALGDGYDVFIAVASGSGNGLIDTIDGGGNTGSNPFIGAPTKGDTYDGTSAANGLTINLDTVTHTEAAIPGGLTYAASQATGADIGIDKIKNFESAVGGNAGDVIFGNAQANYLNGNGGHDVLHGYAGNDFILGGTGSDFLFGDKGADTLSGGASYADGAADYFFYAALTDSTVAHGGRDTISFFEDNFDQIIFQGIPGHVGGTFTGVDKSFAPVAGQFEVRVLTTLSGWTIQVDVNGDGKADMAIDVADVAHDVTWTGADFLI